ncbi:MAG: GlcNAc-transferase family protein, partial [Ilumatobacter sp.]|nr:GlcNAc-transferase family protein [Ilumatobacter sp.]
MSSVRARSNTRRSCSAGRREDDPVESARFWRLATDRSGPTGNIWDVQYVEFRTEHDVEVTALISSGDAGAGYTPKRAFSSAIGYWGGRACERPDEQSRLHIGVKFESPVVPTQIILQHALGPHHPESIRVESSQDGETWQVVRFLVIPERDQHHIVFYYPTEAESSSGWRLLVDSPTTGFAWDVRRLSFLRAGQEVNGALTASGAAGSSFGVENTRRDDNQVWGGRADNANRFHIALIAETSELCIDSIEIDQTTQHWTETLVLQCQDEAGDWHTWRHFAGLRPGHNQLFLYEQPAVPPIPSPATTNGRAVRAAEPFEFGQFDDRRILVLIAAYRDAELLNTIASAITQAAYPEHLRFAVCHQFDDETVSLLEPWTDDPRFSIDSVHHSHSLGCGWARNRTFAMFDDEPYILQIDAHTRFAARWDARYIDMLESTESDLPVLTTYPPRYSFDTDGEVIYDTEAGVQRLYIAEVRPDLSTLQRTTPASDLSRPGPSPTVAAGQIFTRGQFCRDVDYDPEIYFAGEEISLAARAFTSGYDLYYPTETLLWHLYDHKYPKHWEDHSDHSVAHASTAARLRTLFQGDATTLGKFGLGLRRSLVEFENFAGIDLGANPVEPDGTLKINIDRSAIEP